MDDSLPIEKFLAQLGFPPGPAQEVALEVLWAEGLSRPGKSGISASKRAAALAALAEWTVRHCPDARCAAWADEIADGRTAVEVKANDCERCGGSNNARAAALMVERCLGAGMTRILIVGGAPGTAREVAELLDDLEVRMIEGTTHVDERRAAVDLDWADLVVIWGGTILDHRVSSLYNHRHPDTVLVNRRGFEALAAEVVGHLDLAA